MSDKLYFDNFKNLFESVEDKPETHEASPSNLKNYMEEGKRKVDEFAQDGEKAIVYYNSEDEEYCVKFYKDGEYQKDADYFTDDKDDAIGTAKLQIKLDESGDNSMEGYEDELEERAVPVDANSEKHVHPDRGEVFDILLNGSKVDRVYFKHFSPEEVKDTLVAHADYSSDIEVKLVEACEEDEKESDKESDEPLEEAKGDMGEEVDREDMGDSLKGYSQDDLYDIIKFLKGYKAEEISSAIEKMKKWKLDQFNESNLSREMGLNEAKDPYHKKETSGEYVGSKKVAGVEVDYYIKFKVEGKKKFVNKVIARFGDDKGDVLEIDGRHLNKDDKIFGHLHAKYSDKTKAGRDKDKKESDKGKKAREDNYKEFEKKIEDGTE